MKKEIKELMDAKPKHYSQMAQRNPDMVEFVEAHSEEECANFAERIHQALHGITTAACHNGKRYKFKSAKDGYVFCGRGKECACANESKSKAVSATKAKRTRAEIDAENAKREATFLSKSNVSNAGQLEQAKKAHADFYADDAKVAEATRKNKEAKLKNHGDENYNNREQCKTTCLAKYNVENPMQLPEISIPNGEVRKALYGESDYFLNLAYDRLSEKFRVEHNIQFVTTKENYTGVIKAHYDFKCLKCGHEFHTYIDCGHTPVCRVCNPREHGRSIEENEVLEYLTNDLGIKGILTNDYSMLDNGQELDIAIPHMNIAIEYHGQYYHHDGRKNKDKNYHIGKYLACKEKGIQLISIYSGMWKNKKEIVKNRLKQKLGISTESVYARKCTLSVITNKQARDFCDTHHIQGGCNAKHNYALSFNDEMVAVMTFGKTRKGITASAVDRFELIRYASKGRVVGGASKLFKAFINSVDPSEIVTYSQNEWNTGNLYNMLGFSYDGITKAGYWYFNKNNERLLHRSNFQKRILIEQGFDPNKTEAEIMKERGFLKIWDCGNTRWVWKKSS